MPCVAKHLLSLVLSTTPGNFFALYTWNLSLKHAASTGAMPRLILPLSSGGAAPPCVCGLGVMVVEPPTLTKLKRSLGGVRVGGEMGRGEE